MEATVVEVLAKFRAEVGEFNKKVGQVEAQLKALQNTTKRTSEDVSSGFGKMEGAARKFATAAGAISAVTTGATVNNRVYLIRGTLV